jgi:hypothetical protein
MWQMKSFRLVAHLCARLRIIGTFAKNTHFARRGTNNSQQRFDERGFSGAVEPNESECRTSTHFQIESSQRFDAATSPKDASVGLA